MNRYLSSPVARHSKGEYFVSLISVVIPTKNRPDYLAEAVASVQVQGVDDLEIIIINDGGCPVEEKLHAEFGPDRITVFNNPVSLGPSRARNIGVHNSSGRYVALLDDDDVYLKDHLARCLDVLENGHADMVYCDAPVIDRRDHGGNLANVQWHHAFDFPYYEPVMLAANFIPTSTIACVNWRGRAEFDPALRVLEDWDLWLQLIRRLGYKFHHLAEPGVIYHRTATHASATTDSAADIEAFLLFSNGYELLTQRWPAKTNVESRYREAMGDYFTAALQRLRSGGSLPLFFYENILRALVSAHEAGRTDGLGAVLAREVNGGN
jgi:glycosyltransferase involved in cell wall biosynthesis